MLQVRNIVQLNAHSSYQKRLFQAISIEFLRRYQHPRELLRTSLQTAYYILAYFYPINGFQNIISFFPLYLVSKYSVQLAHLTAPDLFRGIFIDSILMIKESMRNNFSLETFGWQTLNFRGDMEEFIGHLPASNENEECMIIVQRNIPGSDEFLLFGFKSKWILEKVRLIDRIHRTLAAKEAFPEFSTGSYLVICDITNMPSYDDMKQFVYKHSQRAATVEKCFINFFCSARKDLANDVFANTCKENNGIKSSSALENMTRLRRNPIQSSCSITSQKKPSSFFLFIL